MKVFDFWFPKHEFIEAGKRCRLLVQLSDKCITGVCEIDAITKNRAVLYGPNRGPIAFVTIGHIVCIRKYRQGKIPKQMT